MTTAECSYKEIDRPLKKQFMHGLNDDDMMIEKTKELTETGENESVTSEQILT